ncbi:hypothetical protein ABIB25_005221 [Nakamurella sp. UYEF19]|uniref:hypothetical protein n=1 Tax=Nakamurella sp. UYEF19 TaxID=1756392 RepID=UPI00339B273C
MDRRRIGMLVLVVLALAAVVVPGIAGRAVPGRPVAAVVPPPPQTGDCLVGLTGLSHATYVDDTDTRIKYPWATYGACSGPIVGEVTSVDPTAHPLATATIGTYQSASSLCELAEVNYVGSVGPFDPATITTPGIGWQTVINIASLSIGPTPLQRAAGQSWTACIGATGDNTTYRGRIGGALDRGVLPPIFASCWAAFRAPERPQSCVIPHPLEIIATTEVFGVQQSVAQINKSCLGMAGRAMRTADPGKGGRLKIGVYVLEEPLYDRLTPLTTAALRQGNYQLSCVASVAEPDQLVGTIIGLGDKPLPLA